MTELNPSSEIIKTEDSNREHPKPNKIELSENNVNTSNTNQLNIQSID